ncbi:MAG: glycosyltransferase family 4 protein [Chloroflexaceae bacterium]|nr:glycosyltransferase family 4 protein [Chloroflexaceae bacterium]
MRIAILIYGLDGIGGIAKHTLYLSRELVALGHDLTLYAVEYNQQQCYPDITRNLDIRSFRSVETPFAVSMPHYPGLRMLNYIQSIGHYYHDQRILSAALAEGYDVVNPHGNTISWAAATYKQRYGTPVVWLCNDFLPIGSHRYEQVSGTLATMKHQLKSALFEPICRYDETSVRSIDTIAVLSSRVQQQMQEHYQVSSQIVRPGVDSVQFARGDAAKIRQRHGIDAQTFLIMTVSMPMPRRRIEDVIRATRLLRDQGHPVQYMVVGRTSHSADYMALLEQEIAACDLADHVTFTGEVAEHELPDYYHACQAFVWASDENQSWGMAGMEAMAAGKPTLVSQANGLAEVLEDGMTALLIPPRSPEAIATAIHRIITEPAWATALAQRGQQFVQQHYSWRRHAEEMVNLFEEAVGRPHRTEQTQEGA